MKNTPGIFNHIIGPVMRGPSSSHTAASWRIGRTALDILGEPLKDALIEFDEQGAWAPNFREQGTVMGMDGGLLGLDITDDRIKDTSAEAKKQNINIHYAVSIFKAKHPNTARLTLTGINGKKIQITGISLGGGAFDIRQVDEFTVSITGDSHELLLNPVNNSSIRVIEELIPSGNLMVHQGSENDKTLVQVKSSSPFDPAVLDSLRTLPQLFSWTYVSPVLPLTPDYDANLPFVSVDEMLEYSLKTKLDAGELGLLYEKSFSGLSEYKLKNTMQKLITIIHNSIHTGLTGTAYSDRILPQQSNFIKDAVEAGKIPGNKLINEIISNVTAIMEAKSSMEVIVANPTAGSCGTVGGLLKAVSDEIGSTSNDLINAYFAAGIIGVFFAMGPGFSAEEHGCQVECGAAAGMAAAGVVQLYGGTAKQAVDAASMAIQNMIGLVCDPVADRVEVPCLGKNISAAVNALTSATMACAGFDAVIPLEEVIQTVSQVSEQMPACNKCTGKGGLAITPTAQRLKESLGRKAFY